MRPRRSQEARSKRQIVIVADYDVDATINAFRPNHAQGVDEYLSNVARQRRQGKMVF